MPARLSSAQAQDSSNTPSSTPSLIPSPSEEINETYKVPCDLTSDLESISNPTNQLPSYESETTVQANNNYYCLPRGHTPMQIKHNQVVVKNKWKGDEGSKQFTSNSTAATEALKPGFGAAKHFIQWSKDGENVDAGNTNYTYFQEFYCSNLTKVDSLEYCVISYNFKDIIMLRELSDVKQFDPQVISGPSK